VQMRKGMRILVAYDGSPSANAAVEEVIRRPWPAGTQIRLITVVDQPVPVPAPDGTVYWPLLETVPTVLREEAYHHLRDVLGKFNERPDLETSYELREGSPKRCLLEAIQEWGADLVIAGSHGKGSVERIFLGSVSHALVTHAPCSVEVIKVGRMAA